MALEFQGHQTQSRLANQFGVSFPRNAGDTIVNSCSHSWCSDFGRLVMTDGRSSYVWARTRKMSPGIERMNEQTNGRNRSDIAAGQRVLIVQKQDQQSGKTTDGIVKDILTKSRSHPHGIKVRLVTGEVGRVKGLPPCDS